MVCVAEGQPGLGWEPSRLPLSGQGVLHRISFGVAEARSKSREPRQLPLSGQGASIGFGVISPSQRGCSMGGRDTATSGFAGQRIRHGQ